VSVFRRNAISTLAACVSYAGFFPRPMRLPTASFFARGLWSFSQRKNISGVGHDALAGVCFF